MPSPPRSTAAPKILSIFLAARVRPLDQRARLGPPGDRTWRSIAASRRARRPRWSCAASPHARASRRCSARAAQAVANAGALPTASTGSQPTTSGRVSKYQNGSWKRHCADVHSHLPVLGNPGDHHIHPNEPHGVPSEEETENTECERECGKGDLLHPRRLSECTADRNAPTSAQRARPGAPARRSLATVRLRGQRAAQGGWRGQGRQRGSRAAHLAQL